MATPWKFYILASETRMKPASTCAEPVCSTEDILSLSLLIVLFMISNALSIPHSLPLQETTGIQGVLKRLGFSDGQSEPALIVNCSAIMTVHAAVQDREHPTHLVSDLLYLYAQNKWEFNHFINHDKCNQVLQDFVILFNYIFFFFGAVAEMNANSRIFRRPLRFTCIKREDTLKCKYYDFWV